jgi:hypothetical protein
MVKSKSLKVFKCSSPDIITYRDDLNGFMVYTKESPKIERVSEKELGQYGYLSMFKLTPEAEKAMLELIGKIEKCEE